MPTVLLVEEGGRGGVADYTALLAEGVRDAGWSVRLATARDHHHGALPGIRIHRPFAYARHPRLRSSGASRPLNGLMHAAAIAPLAALARRSDVVHLQGGGEFAPLQALTARALAATGRPLVWTPHNTFARDDRHASAWAAMYAASACVVVHAQADLPNLPPAVRAVVVPHGEYGGLARTGGPPPDPAAARAALGLPPDAVVALLFGHLRPDKGLDVLLRAAADVPGLHVVVAGEDSGALEPAGPLLAALGDRVVLREGFHPMADTAAFFAAADLAVLPYARASASGVLLLAYGFARAVVVTPVGGLPEAVEPGRTGWIAEAADAPALAAVLREAVAAGRDELHRRGREGAALAAERFSWPAIGRATTRVYDDLLA